MDDTVNHHHRHNAKTQGGKKMTVRLVKGPTTGDGDEECDARLQGASVHPPMHYYTETLP
jgi:hypothetical protein